MKKTFISLALALALVLSLQTVASANDNRCLKSGSKVTPYGTMEGGIYWSYLGVDSAWLYASTSINSSYTMAQITAKLEVRANDTGKLLDQGSETLEDTNSVECFADGDRSYGTLALFSTHEVTYTRSYVFYLSATV